MKKVFMLTILAIMVGTISIAMAGHGDAQGGKMGGMSGKGKMGSPGGGMMMKGEHSAGDMMPMMQHMNKMMGKMTGMMEQKMNMGMDQKQMMNMADMMDQMSDHMKEMSNMMKKGDFSEKHMNKLKGHMMKTDERMDQMMK